MKKQDRSIVKSYIKYYSDVTGNSSDDFYKECVGERSWLVSHIIDTLNTKGIDFDSLLEYKDIIHRMDNVVAKVEGEFYTPLIWAKEAHTYIKGVVGEDWGTANIWDASCGTGNLLAELDYPQDKVFCSTLNAPDIDVVKSRLPYATAFPLDFLSGIDYDEYNEFFSENLPENLRAKLQAGEPFIFLMNPPYFQTSNSTTDMGIMMKERGIKDSVELYCQFYFRVMLLKEYYHLDKVWIGFFHPLSRREYVFNLADSMVYHQGFCFDKSEFAGTQSVSSTWYVGFHIWSSIGEPQPVSSLPFMLSTNIDGKVYQRKVVQSERRNNDYKTWVLSGYKNNGFTYLPHCNGSVVDPEKLIRVHKDALGFFCGDFVLSSGKSDSWFDTLPYSISYALTKESFYKLVPQIIVSIARANSLITNLKITVGIPQEGEGYEQWLADCLVLMLFSSHSRFRSMRGITVERDVIDVMNCMFPIEKDKLLPMVTDEVIKADMERTGVCNQFIVDELKRVSSILSDEARAFFDFCFLSIVESLQGDYRKVDGYVGDTHCWDVGIYQVRKLKTFWTAEKDKKYFALQADLRDKLVDGLFKYGFISEDWKGDTDETFE